MSVLDSAAPDATTARGGHQSGNRPLRWLPALVLIVSLAGAGLVIPSVNRDQVARDYYRGQLGGSSVYSLDTTVARLMPFLVGASVAIALLQRQRQRLRKARVDTGPSVRRHGPTEVVSHWLNAVGIGIGLLTAAWLLRWLVLIFLAIHVGALVLVPRNWPLLKSMITTRIARAYVKQHLPLWSEQLGDRDEEQ